MTSIQRSALLPYPVAPVYALVGIAAIYQAVGLRSIQRRWNVSPAPAA